MQFLMSLGGNTANSRRSRPELPPSSVTVTTAVISTAGGAQSAGAAAKGRRPLSTVESPVPPPIATILRGGLTALACACPTMAASGAALLHPAHQRCYLR